MATVSTVVASAGMTKFIGRPSLTIGELGNVADDDAPQFTLAMGDEVEVAKVDVTEKRADEKSHAATRAVPPTVLNKMTIPRSASTKHVSGTTAMSTIFFTVDHRCLGFVAATKTVAKFASRRHPLQTLLILLTDRNCRVERRHC
jgi:hypothetical protein